MQEDGKTTAVDGTGRDRKIALAIGSVLLLVGVAAAILFAGSSDPAKSVTSPTALVLPNGNPANSRWTGGPIEAANVANLALAWRHPLTGDGPLGAHWSTPVVVSGVVYSQDTSADVQAIDLEKGQILWETPYGSPVEGPNGIVVTGGRVYGATATHAFALDQTTGKEVWSVKLTRNETEEISMTPGYERGMVYFSTVPAPSKTGGVGILWALDAKTGEKIWHFDTVPRSLWGDAKLNFGGGLSESPAFDGEGSMYLGINSPGPVAGTKQHPWGTSRPGPNLYTNSVMKLDARTGKLEWYYQLTPHALCDWDLQGPPILVKSGGRNVVIAGGRAGIVIALDRESGELIWKRPVGIHNGHDADGVQAMKGNYSGLKTPLTVYPGSEGGIASPSSTDGEKVYVPVVNQPTTLIAQRIAAEGKRGSGELAALDVDTGTVSWRRPFTAPVYGATTVVNDLVLASSIDGFVYALDSETGEIIWQARLPTGIVAGLAVSGDTVLAPAGADRNTGRASMVAFKLGY